MSIARARRLELQADFAIIFNCAMIRQLAKITACISALPEANQVVRENI
ncbi:MAG: hypothetical protein ACMUIP_06305 [bacterium]